MRTVRSSAAWGLLVCCLVVGGCGFGPRALEKTRLPYNEAVKTTSEQQLLLNIVRLRYGESPSSLAVSSIAAQFECQTSGQLVPFFASAASGAGEVFQTNGAILPGAQLSHADRPTISFTPLDDSDYYRKLFTPLTLEGVLYLADTSWPISTVLRLFLEFVNGVSNAEAGSGPESKVVPVYEEFLRGMHDLQLLRDREDVHSATQEHIEKLGGAVPAASVTAHDVIEAARNGQEYLPDADGKTWTLIKRSKVPVLAVNPPAVASPEMLDFESVFHLRPGRTAYEVTHETIPLPFPAAFPPEGLEKLEIQPRSLGQAMFFVANGVEVPPEHVAQGIVGVTVGPDGQVFDWKEVMHGLFKVCWAKGRKPPPHAYVAVCYRDYWFYIDDRDQDTKVTFALLLAVNRLELMPKTTQGPVLTLPLGAH